MSFKAFNHAAGTRSLSKYGKMAQNPCTTLTGQCTEKLHQPPTQQKILSSLIWESYHLITDG
ncbi:MAG: hypothetical protein F6J96_17530 [Symploca sp. SIO1C2]|nr:hypothetical protein [Symploca sp. SIO1C2]NER22463.1 hypothetical protein [Symploca sp. SIO1C2]